MSTDDPGSTPTFSQVLENLRDVHAQMQERYEQLVDAKEEVRLSPIILVLDEGPQGTSSTPPCDREVSAEVRATISQIASKGRSASASIHLALVSAPDAKLPSGETRENLTHVPLQGRTAEHG